MTNPASVIDRQQQQSDAIGPPWNVLTVAEVARELRCSKAHVHHLITGKVRGVRPLPSLWLGRRRLILRASFDEWVRATEHAAPGSVL
jgi:excisionase family DNA binding protein